MSLTSTYDHEADALYVRFGVPRVPASTRLLAPGIMADVDADGQLIGLELLDASTRVSADALSDLGAPTTWLSLIEAGEVANLSPTTLRVQLHNGRLDGEKRGRDWFIARHVLLNYLEEVEERSRAATPAQAEPAKVPRATYRAADPRSSWAVTERGTGRAIGARIETASVTARVNSKALPARDSAANKAASVLTQKATRPKKRK